ncbi:MAG: S8 family serine peptidase [Thermoplasmatota archaeon]
MSCATAWAAAFLMALPLGLVSATAGPPSAAGPSAADYVILFARLPAERAHYGSDAVAAVDSSLRFMVVHARDPAALERRARADPDVLRYERDSLGMQALLAPADPLFAGYQYDLKAATTGIDAAWDTTTGAPTVLVCVVDTGQYRAHQDFAGTHWGAWKDFVAGKATPYDDNGHGTHVTGTIAATLGNADGIAGIAPGVTVAGAKVLNRQGSGTYSAVASGIAWCADQGAAVVNLSLGGADSATVASAVSYATAKGALVVAAAGNSGPCTSCVGYPAAQPEAFAVACTDAADLLCSFSSQGPEVDIAAPGKDIVSTYPAGIQPCQKRNGDCFVLLSGTSMSTPHVAGLAALVKSAHPAFTNADLRARLQATALDLGAPGADAQFGAGLVQGEAVL